MNTNNIPLHRAPWLALLGACALAASAGCSSMKTPATAEVAASRATVETATQAGAGELAPAEMASARDKLAMANQALAAKDYKGAMDLANQAQADAKLAQGKASSTKAQMAANALQDDIRVLRDELARANNTPR